MLGAHPADYWRLADTGTTTAVNQVNGGTATYNNVTQGVSGGPFADTTVDGFNGTTSYLALPTSADQPGQPVGEPVVQDRPAPAEVLFSSSADSPANARPRRTRSRRPCTSAGRQAERRVRRQRRADDQPRQRRSTTASGTTWCWPRATSSQTLYLDGKQVGTVSGRRSSAAPAAGEAHVYVGTGFLGADWPDQPHYSTTSSTGYPAYFTGDIAEVAFYPHAADRRARSPPSGPPPSTPRA